MTGVPQAPAAARNTRPILGVLVHELRGCRTVLEIGSGTGQHAVAAAAALPDLTWQPSDLAERLPGIRAQAGEAGVANVLEPVALDVHSASADRQYDAVFTANTLHIVSEAGVQRLVRFAGASIVPGGLFCCYGPFRRGGSFNTDSNAAFDRSLRSSSEDMGIRDLETIDGLCAAAGLVRTRTYAMPANNLLVCWQKQGVAA